MKFESENWTSRWKHDFDRRQILGSLVSAATLCGTLQMNHPLLMVASPFLSLFTGTQAVYRQDLAFGNPLANVRVFKDESCVEK